eukprot:Nk52_evm12s244 gene=Nk52_evmTU12s244
MDVPEPSDSLAPAKAHPLLEKIQQKYQKLLDDSVPHLTARWIVCGVLLLTYFIRTIYLQGWYIVTYALGIYLLNLFIAFLTPRFDPATEMGGDSGDEEDDGLSLPTKRNEEFRPFIRRLPEFKFWHRSVNAILFSWVCTFFEFTNVPVFWPILVMYFLLLFFLTMKRQIKHMIKHKYVPWEFGKKKYAGKSDSGKVYAK